MTTGLLVLAAYVYIGFVVFWICRWIRKHSKHQVLLVATAIHIKKDIIATTRVLYAWFKRPKRLIRRAGRKIKDLPKEVWEAWENELGSSDPNPGGHTNQPEP